MSNKVQCGNEQEREVIFYETLTLKFKRKFELPSKKYYLFDISEYFWRNKTVLTNNKRTVYHGLELDSSFVKFVETDKNVVIRRTFSSNGRDTVSKEHFFFKKF